jgi:hypothetical protein
VAPHNIQNKTTKQNLYLQRGEADEGDADGGGEEPEEQAGLKLPAVPPSGDGGGQRWWRSAVVAVSGGGGQRRWRSAAVSVRWLRSAVVTQCVWLRSACGYAVRVVTQCVWLRSAVVRSVD